MPNFFAAGPELVQWDLEVIQTNSSYGLKLTVRHAQGEIVEYFRTTKAALIREQELENLLIAARTAPGHLSLSLTQ